MLQSLRSPLVISNLTITLAGLLVVVAVFLRVVSDRTVSLKRAELQKQSHAVATQLDRLFALHAGQQTLAIQVDSASRLLGERVIVVNRTGNHIVDSAGTTPYVTGSWHPIDIEALQHGTIATSQRKNLLLFQAPLHDPRSGAVIGAVQLVATVADVTPDLTSLLEIVAVALGTVLAVWLLIALYFTAWVYRPLIRITAATVQMAHGEYSARVRVGGPKEIVDLARSFNSMAAQIQSSNQVLRDFVANVSHDLRTPLTMIAGYSEALVDGTAGPEDVELSASIIHEEAGRMQTLVDDLLQLTKLEAGLQVLDRHPTPLLPFVQSTVVRLSRAVPERAARIEVEVPADLPRADIDPDRLERALRNLIENALEYGGASPVTVRAQAVPGDMLEISVSDGGQGIPEAELPRVFERFYRADRGRGREQGHSGLGLAIVREIVEAHGGHVRVDSEAGAGTTFRFTVPRARGQAQEREVPSPASLGTQAAP